MKIGNRTVRFVVDDTVDQEEAMQEFVDTYIYFVTNGDLDGYLANLLLKLAKHKRKGGETT